MALTRTAPLDSEPPTETDIPFWVEYLKNVELDTHRQGKENAALERSAFTCELCPNPYRALERCSCESEWSDRYGTLSEGGTSPECSCGYFVEYTKRCRECNNKMKNWQRGKRYHETLMMAKNYFEGTWLAFVTLTLRNIEDNADRKELDEEVRRFKRKVSSLRRKKEFEKVVLGGLDAFETTTNTENNSWNIHHHGIWLMQDKYELQKLRKDWSRSENYLARVKIEKVRQPERAIRYCIKYAMKSPIEGVRCLETFGIARGSARSALEDFVQLRKEVDAEGASD